MTDGSWPDLVVDETTRPGDTGDVTVLRVCGEVDLASRGVFAAAVGRVVPTTPRPVVIDLSGMVFCDAAGLATLMQATTRAADAGLALALVGLSPRLATLCALLWPGAQPVPTTAAERPTT